MKEEGWVKSAVQGLEWQGVLGILGQNSYAHM